MRASTMDRILRWDDSYAIACELKKYYSDIELENVTLNMIFRWTMGLNTFVDDPELANDEILALILQEWVEEEDNQ